MTENTAKFKYSDNRKDNYPFTQLDIINSRTGILGESFNVASKWFDNSLKDGYIVEVKD